MKKSLYIIPLIFLLGCWLLAWRSFGSAIVPSPWRTLQELVAMCAEKQVWQDVFTTLLRGLAGLCFSAVLAFAIGIPCGFYRFLLKTVSPIVAVVQSCPPIVWISLLLVWVGIGSILPVTVVFASAFPVLFINISQGVAHIDKRYFEMARLFNIPKWRVLKDIVLPGIAASVRSSFAFAIGITWKVTATAEFFGAQNGLGARIQLSFQQLNMPRLFALTSLIAILGIAVDTALKAAKS